MWFIFALITFFSWGIADIFYKKGNTENSKYDHLKTGIIVGLVMGIHATIYLIVKDVNINISDIIKYLPVSFCYILSMILGYKGLKYIYLSVSSPIQNSSGIITSILLCIIFSISLSKLEILGILIVFIGVLLLSYIEVKSDKKSKLIKPIYIIFPILYALIDGMGTFLDAVYLDQLSIVSEDIALIAYEYTFLIYGLILLIYLKIKKENINIIKEKNKIKAALFETIGQFTYVFAVASDSIMTVPIVACYGVLSVLLSRIFLKEKLSILQYIAICIVFIGILILGLVEAL